jgi:hypothetical protein
MCALVSHGTQKKHAGEVSACSRTALDDRLTLSPCLPADNNDLPNGRFLLQNTLEPALRIHSVDDEYWRGQE